LRFIYTYDAIGNQTEYISYQWDLETNDWINDWKYMSYWSELTTSYPTQSYDLNFKIYPNPVADKLTIETGITEQYSIEINSLNGQQLYNSIVEGPTHQIDFSTFQKGLYFITIRSKDFVRTEKIIKQ